MNIFLQIKDTNFFQADKLQYIDELSKKILQNSIQLQYDVFCNTILSIYDINMGYHPDYLNVNYIKENDNINPLEHCLINNYIYPQNGTRFMNYYNRGIINYLINIGFTSNIELVKQKVDEYKQNTMQGFSYTNDDGIHIGWSDLKSDDPKLKSSIGRL